MLTWLCSMSFSLSPWADRAVYILIIFAREKEKEEVSYTLVLKCVLTFLSLFISPFAMTDKGQGCIIPKKRDTTAKGTECGWIIIWLHSRLKVLMFISWAVENHWVHFQFLISRPGCSEENRRVDVGRNTRRPLQFSEDKGKTLNQGSGSGTGEKPTDLKRGGPSAAQREAVVSDYVAPKGGRLPWWFRW